MELVIRKTRERIGQMRIVYFDLAQGQLHIGFGEVVDDALACLLYTSPSPRDS